MLVKACKRTADFPQVVAKHNSWRATSDKHGHALLLCAEGAQYMHTGVCSNKVGFSARCIRDFVAVEHTGSQLASFVWTLYGFLAGLLAIPPIPPQQGS